MTILGKIHLITRFLPSAIAAGFVILIFSSLSKSDGLKSVAFSLISFNADFPQMQKIIGLAGAFLSLGQLPMLYIAKKIKDHLALQVNEIFHHLGLSLMMASFCLWQFRPV